jgi:hypothetical protein
MLKSTEDNALAFFESLIINPNGVSILRDVFYNGVVESFINTYEDDTDFDIIHFTDTDDYGNSINRKSNFKHFLQDRLAIETRHSKEFIKIRASKVLSQTNFNSTFFSFIENTLIELNSKSKTIDYLEINNTIVDIMQFYYLHYNMYHNFSKEYLDTISVYRKTTKTDKAILAFKWKEKNKQKELEYLYNSLINANPPLINSSFETFYKAFTYRKLEKDESIKWLCKSSKNKKIISKVTLVALISNLYSANYIISDLNDFNKTIQNVFSMPNGVKLKNIKGTKSERSKNPSRIQEIKAILEGLSKIA